MTESEAAALKTQGWFFGVISENRMWLFWFSLTQLSANVAGGTTVNKKTENVSYTGDEEGVLN